jgi:hypothetical protein
MINKTSNATIGIIGGLAFAVVVGLMLWMMPIRRQDAGATAGWGCRGNSGNSGGNTTASPAYSPARQAASEAALDGTTVAPFEYPLPARFPGMTDDQWLKKRANYAHSCALEMLCIGKAHGFNSGVKPANHGPGKCGRTDDECHYCIHCKDGITCGDLPQ